MSAAQDLRPLRWAGYIEGTTLILLLGVAVPLKRIFGVPEFVSIMGPIHGLTFVLYIVITISTVSGGGWSLREALQTAGASILPFGTFLNDRMLARKARKGVDDV